MYPRSIAVEGQVGDKIEIWMVRKRKRERERFTNATLTGLMLDVVKLG